MESEFDRFDELDLLDIIRILRSRLWLIVICFAAAIAISAVVTYNFIVPVYKAETTLFAGKEQNGLSSLNLNELNLGRALVTDYREIVVSRLVAKQVIDDLKLDMSIGTFQDRVSVSTVKDSRFFKIAFESTDPQMAMDVANALGEQIVEKAEEIINVKNVMIIDRAELPKVPIKPNKKLNIAIAALLGLMFGVMLAFFLEFLDRTIKTDRDVERHLGLISIGEIPMFEGEHKYRPKGAGKLLKKFKKSKKSGPQTDSSKLISLTNPKAAASEAYRSLRTNIGYIGVDKQVKTIVLTSPEPNDGKTTTAANLAISIAQTGKRVLVMDADLRKSKVHKYFSLANDCGITEIVVNKLDVQQAIKKVDGVDNLFAICGGTVPPNPSEILESNRMLELIKRVREDFDLVLIDTPPVGQLTDAAILSKHVDGVILVISSAETHIDIAKRALSSIDKVGGKILGAVLTKINGSSGGYYYYKYYNYNKYYYYGK